MKAAVPQSLGRPPELRYFDEPVAGSGQAAVNMAAAAVHHVDLPLASGHFYLGPPPLPSVVGTDGAGYLDDGRRVFMETAASPFGTWAERCIAPTANLSDILRVSTMPPPQRPATVGSWPGGP